MNTKIRNEWADLLESGKYIQGEGGMKIIGDDREIFHCCLGVLCEIHAEETGVAWRARFSDAYSYLGHSGYLPLGVSAWSGLSQDNQLRLSGLNDGGTSFPEIAKEVRKLR